MFITLWTLGLILRNDLTQFQLKKKKGISESL